MLLKRAVLHLILHRDLPVLQPLRLERRHGARRFGGKQKEKITKNMVFLPLSRAPGALPEFPSRELLCNSNRYCSIKLEHNRDVAVNVTAPC